MELSIYDLGLLIIYALVCIGIGVWASKGQKEEDYLIAGRKMKLWPFMASVVASYIGGAAIVAYTAYVYQFGISAIAVFLGTSIGFIVFIPYARPGGISHEEYRARYGLPWRKGLVSRRVSKHLSDRLTKRIKDGSFVPKPDNKAAVKKILEEGMRKDQPFFKKIKSDMTREHNQKNVKYGPKDYENVLSVMTQRKITLNRACMTEGLPTKARVLDYAAANPGFRKKLLDTYYDLPYAVQARADMFSPQFYEDLKRLKNKGLSAKEIGKRLGISYKTVQKRFKQMAFEVDQSKR